MKVTSNDLWMMLVSTFRYSMGRATYMPGVCVEFFHRYAAALTPEQRRQIRDEVAREIELAESTGRTLGMQCDHDTWKAFIACWDADGGGE